MSSRLFAYEIWTRLHARGLTDTYGDAAHSVIGQIAIVEMTPNVLSWINDAIPIDVNLRTLDAIHLATCIFLIDQGQKLAVATYDLRMSTAASTMNIPLFEL